MPFRPSAGVVSVPVSDPAVLVARKEDARRLMWTGFLEVEKCRRCLLYYLERYCWTVDEHERTDPVQRLLHGDFAIDPDTLTLCRHLDGRLDDYLRVLTLVWEQESLVAVPKSRQLRVTHWSMACHGWLARFYAGQRVAVQSKNYEDADALLERLHQSWLKQRERHPNMRWPVWKRLDGRIILPETGSVIMAFAQGEGKLRSYTFSAIFSDETGFQPLADNAYTAAIPTIEGGGKYTAVSSANPGFFQNLCFDRTAK